MQEAVLTSDRCFTTGMCFCCLLDLACSLLCMFTNIVENVDVVHITHTNVENEICLLPKSEALWQRDELILRSISFQKVNMKGEKKSSHCGLILPPVLHHVAALSTVLKTFQSVSSHIHVAPLMHYTRTWIFISFICF